MPRNIVEVERKESLYIGLGTAPWYCCDVRYALGTDILMLNHGPLSSHNP